MYPTKSNVIGPTNLGSNAILVFNFILFKGIGTQFVDRHEVTVLQCERRVVNVGGTTPGGKAVGWEKMLPRCSQMTKTHLSRQKELCGKLLECSKRTFPGRTLTGCGLDPST